MEEPNPVEVRHCTNPRCNKILDNSKRKYCSELCRTRHSALRQYNKLKDDEEFKKRRNVKNKQYYENNKEELKAKMRVYGLQYFYKKREEKKRLEEEREKIIKEVKNENKDNGDNGENISQIASNNQ